MSQYKPPEDTGRLTHNFVKISVETTKRDTSIPLKFISIYQEACKGTIGISDKIDETNLELRHQVRDNLIRNGFIFVDRNDVDLIYLTQKAIDEFDTLPSES